ncbi:hypothetical protein [Lentzea sp. CA-135723]|uniref:hypothetical protein n=1 Tax=Lentzea sp. CA-135723 TaxID=3239950 RepID=UPI003D8AC917
MRVLSSAAMSAEDLSRHAANKPSFYADPVAWLAAAVVGDALERCREELDGTDVAVLAMSATATASTMAGIADGSARGRVSPLRFAGANPGLVAGLPCIRWGLRGPSLVLAMHPGHAVQAALCVARHWLESAQARHVVVVGHELDENVHTVRSVVLAPGRDRPAHVSALLTEVTA